MYLWLNLKDFYDSLLGGNYRCFCTKASGEEYYEDILEKVIIIYLKEDYKYYDGIVINANGVLGVPITFIRTVIELAIESFGVELIEKNIKFVYTENRVKEDRIINLINDTIEFYKSKPNNFKHPDNLKYCERYNLDKNTKT